MLLILYIYCYIETKMDVTIQNEEFLFIKKCKGFWIFRQCQDVAVRKSICLTPELLLNLIPTIESLSKIEVAKIIKRLEIYHK